MPGCWYTRPMRKWYVAPALRQLISEINQKWPNRDKRSDGTIGDAAHSSRDSEHNPNERGSVNAADVDKDGILPDWLVQKLIRDSRVWYVVYNRYIYSRTYNFQKKRYTGPNPHVGHVHVSLRSGATYENDASSWGIADRNLPVAPPTVSRPSTSKPAVTGRSFSLQQVLDGRTHLRKSGNVGVVQARLNLLYKTHKQGRLAVDEYWGASTQRVYDAYRRTLGYTGNDAIGAPGRSSLQTLLGNDYKVI